MSTTPARGLPPRIYIPIVLVIAVVFLSIMAYFLRIGLGVSGSGLGQGASRQAVDSPNPANPGGDKNAASAAQNVSVGGGPPPAVAAQLSQLRTQIEKHPSDDVALVQLGDLYLAVQKYQEAIPLYKRALAANPKNVAAKAGLDEATSGLKADQQR